VLQSQRAEVDAEVEVGAREGLDDGEAEQEVAARHPSGVDDVRAQQRDDDGAAAKDDGAGEVEVCEEVEGEWGGGEEGAGDEDADEGCWGKR